MKQTLSFTQDAWTAETGVAAGRRRASPSLNCVHSCLMSARFSSRSGMPLMTSTPSARPSSLHDAASGTEPPGAAAQPARCALMMASSSGILAATAWGESDMLMALRCVRRTARGSAAEVHMRRVCVCVHGCRMQVVGGQAVGVCAYKAPPAPRCDRNGWPRTCVGGRARRLVTGGWSKVPHAKAVHQKATACARPAGPRWRRAQGLGLP